MDDLFPRDKHLIFYILNNVSVNLSAIIFDHLKESIFNFSHLQMSFILYGRVLSELFEKSEIVRIFQRAQFSSVNALFDESYETFEV